MVPVHAGTARGVHGDVRAQQHLPQRRRPARSAGSRHRRREQRLRHRRRRRPDGRPRRHQHAPRVLVHPQARARPPLGRVRRRRPAPADAGPAVPLRPGPHPAARQAEPLGPAGPRPQAVRDPPRPEQQPVPRPAARRRRTPAGDPLRPGPHRHLHRRAQRRGRHHHRRDRVPPPRALRAALLRRRAAPGPLPHRVLPRARGAVRDRLHRDELRRLQALRRVRADDRQPPRGQAVEPAALRRVPAVPAHRPARPVRRDPLRRLPAPPGLCRRRRPLGLPRQGGPEVRLAPADGHPPAPGAARATDRVLTGTAS